ncbi:MAG: GTPase Era [Bdellovibrionales bacterium]
MSYRAGYVGLIGMPNAGKSTLANAVVREKISIVSRKAQTTRKRLLGVVSEENFQMVLQDAPGVINTKHGINNFIQDEYRDVVNGSDVICLVLNIDARTEDEIQKILKIGLDSGKPLVAVISKQDKGMIHRVEKMKYLLRENNIPVREISALKNPELSREKFIELVEEHLPSSPAPLFDPEYYTTSSVRQMVGEIIREKCFDYLHEEIPYGLAVRLQDYQEGEKIDRIYADIMIEKEAHKQIVIGKKGQSIKRISQESRLEIEELIGKKVYLETFVKVQEDWTSSRRMRQELGYVVQG